MSFLSSYKTNIVTGDKTILTELSALLTYFKTHITHFYYILTFQNEFFTPSFLICFTLICDEIAYA